MTSERFCRKDTPAHTANSGRSSEEVSVLGGQVSVVSPAPRICSTVSNAANLTYTSPSVVEKSPKRVYRLSVLCAINPRTPAVRCPSAWSPWEAKPAERGHSCTNPPFVTDFHTSSPRDPTAVRVWKSPREVPRVSVCLRARA